MGSFQQISLGAICLAAAFFFGNYVNNNPPLTATGHPNGLANSFAANETLTQQAGNVQSRLLGDQIGDFKQQAAPIVTLKQPLKSRFGLPGIPSDSLNRNQIGLPNQPALDQSMLPPPSKLPGQLAQKKPLNDFQNQAQDLFRNQRGSDQTATMPNFAGESNQTKRDFSNPSLIGNQSYEPAAVEPVVHIPDFSQIAAEFKNLPAKLPPTGMPVHSQVNNSSGSSRRLNSQSKSPLKELVSQFKNPNQTLGQPLNQSQRPNWTQDARGNYPEKDWATSQVTNLNPPKNFTSEDFSPQLNEDIFGLKPQPNPPNFNHPTDLAELQSSQLQQVSSGWEGHRNRNRLPNNRNAEADLGHSQNYQGGFEMESDYPANSSSNIDETSRRSSQTEFYDSNQQKFADRGPAPNIAPVQGSQNLVRTRLPFSLNKQAKTELVQLRNRINQKMGLESTKFVSHTIERGETLQAISTRYFGGPDYYLDIYLANRDKLRNPTDTVPGTTIQVPVYDEP